MGFFKVWGGTQKTPELSSGRQAPYRTSFPHWVSVLGTHMYQCTSWRCCERLHSALKIPSEFFLKDFQHVNSFHDGWFMNAPAHTPWSAQQFLTKNHMTPVSTPPCSHDLTPSDVFFVSRDEKKPQRETFGQHGRGGTRTGRSTKRHQHQHQVQTLFWVVEKNVLIGVLHQTESALKVPEVQTCKNEHTIFYK